MLAELANILSIMGAIAVLITLVTIFIQLRQSNLIAISNSYQNLTTTFNALIMGIAQDSALLELYTRGRHNPEELTAIERERFFFLCSQVLSFHENLYLLHRHRTLPHEFFEGWKKDLEKDLKQSGFLLYLQEQGDEYSFSFQRYVAQVQSLEY